jgi:hypothetical protein
LPWSKSVPDDSTRGTAIRSFFAENQHLFSSCPFRPSLAHLDELETALADRILAHMLGHILDHRAGQPSGALPHEESEGISPDGIDKELRYVYNDCNNDALIEARALDPAVKAKDSLEYQGFGPEQRGCCGADVRAELMAEAIRAYMRDPGYLKSAAPNVAARIRAAVNPNPNLNRIIQFN